MGDFDLHHHIIFIRPFRNQAFGSYVDMCVSANVCAHSVVILSCLVYSLLIKVEGNGLYLCSSLMPQ